MCIYIYIYIYICIIVYKHIDLLEGCIYGNVYVLNIISACVGLHLEIFLEFSLNPKSPNPKNPKPLRPETPKPLKAKTLRASTLCPKPLKPKPLEPQAYLNPKSM